MTLLQTQNDFKKQFTLYDTNEQSDSFYKNNLNYINSPQTYVNQPITPLTMYPYNSFNLFKNYDYILNHGNLNYHRDNTLVINDWDTNITGQYAQPKTEIPPLFVPISTPLR